MALQYSAGYIHFSTCVNNFSHGSGGCLAIADGANPYIDNFLMENNTALEDGGGMYCIDNCEPDIHNTGFL